jgi:membrane-associated phospholipid phosphatase
MAEVVTACDPPVEPHRSSSGWWPVDWVILWYFCVTGLLIVLYWSRLPEAWWLLGLRLAGILLLVLAQRVTLRWLEPVCWTFRHWYSVVYVALCYKEMAILIPAIRGITLDSEMARLDFALWGVHPTVWLERVHSPWLTEYLQIVYVLFVPMVLLVAALLWLKRRLAEFRYYAFLISLGFLVSYLGYLLVPVRGPLYLRDQLQSFPLQGLWSFQILRDTIAGLESIHFDCFPSGHTELTLLAWWSSRRISKGLFGVFSVYTVCMIFATVYLRYHYTIDLFAGAGVALALLVAAPRIYGKRRLLG